MNKVRLATLSVLAMAILWTFAILPSIAWSNITLGEAFIVGWMFLPYGLMLFVMSLAPTRNRKAYDLACFVTALLLLLFALLVYGSAMPFNQSSTASLILVWAPCWMVAGSPVVFVIVLVLAWRRTIDPYDEEGHPRCVGCGYNLTGNVSGICPECGRPCDTLKSSR